MLRNISVYAFLLLTILTFVGCGMVERINDFSQWENLEICFYESLDEYNAGKRTIQIEKKEQIAELWEMVETAWNNSQDTSSPITFPRVVITFFSGGDKECQIIIDSDSMFTMKEDVNKGNRKILSGEKDFYDNLLKIYSEAAQE